LLDNSQNGKIRFVVCLTNSKGGSSIVASFFLGVFGSNYIGSSNIIVTPDPLIMYVLKKTTEKW